MKKAKSERHLRRVEDPSTPRAQCEQRAWCDVPGPTHTGAHDGEPDLPPITATANRESFAGQDDGIGVPEVFARLIEQTEASNTFERLAIALSVVSPHGESATEYLTLHEAELLAKALDELLQDARECEVAR